MISSSSNYETWPRVECSASQVVWGEVASGWLVDFLITGNKKAD